MNEDFVCFEIAKKLKDKGFNKPCVAYYIPDCSKLYFNAAILLKKSTVEDCLFSNNTTPIGYVCSTFIDAPIIPQVLKWLREEKKIYVTVNVEREDWFEYKIVQLIKNTRCTGNHVYETYDDAILAGIEYVIDNLI